MECSVCHDAPVRVTISNNVEICPECVGVVGDDVELSPDDVIEMLPECRLVALHPAHVPPAPPPASKSDMVARLALRCRRLEAKLEECERQRQHAEEELRQVFVQLNDLRQAHRKTVVSVVTNSPRYLGQDD